MLNRRDALFLLIAIGLIFITPQIALHFRSDRLSAKVLAELDGPLARQIESGRKTLIYLHTPACYGCMVVKPTIDSIAQEFPDAVYDFDVSREREMGDLFEAPAVPFVVLIRQGKIKDVLLGTREKEKIRKFFNERRAPF
jgi:hypothetical protein